MKFIIGTKGEMTQVYRADGTPVAVTRVHAGPCVVTQIKTMDSDGYAAVQVGFGRRRRLAKPQVGQAKGLGTFRGFQEFRVEPTELEQFHVGDAIAPDAFAVGDVVKVTGISKGRGFQGVVKRHGFGGHPKTHGHKDQLRMPGSAGATAPQHVLLGRRRGGHMGTDQVTVKNLEIIGIEADALLVKGGIPGSEGEAVWIQGEGTMTLTPKAAAQPVEATQAPVESATEQAPKAEGTAPQA